MKGPSIIGLFIMMFYYSWQLSVILIVLAPIVSIAIRLVSKRFRNISKNMQNTMGQVTTSAEQMLKGHKEVLIFGGQQVETERFNSVSNRMRQQGMKLVSASSISDPIIQLIASLALAFVLFAASFPSVMSTPDRRYHYRGVLVDDRADAPAEVADQRQCPVPTRDGGMPDAVLHFGYGTGKKTPAPAK